MDRLTHTRACDKVSQAVRNLHRMNGPHRKMRGKDWRRDHYWTRVKDKWKLVRTIEIQTWYRESEKRRLDNSHT